MSHKLSNSDLHTPYPTPRSLSYSSMAECLALDSAFHSRLYWIKETITDKLHIYNTPSCASLIRYYADEIIIILDMLDRINSSVYERNQHEDMIVTLRNHADKIESLTS